MVKNFFKTAIRRIIRNRSISIINILGLSMGLAATFTILLYIFHELSYDRYHENNDRIYRVIQENKLNNMHLARVPFPLGEILKEEYPEIKETARIFNLFRTEVEKNTHFIREDHFFCAENSLFDILTIPVIKGNSDNLTNHPNDVALSEAMALKYFGSKDILGKKLNIRILGEKKSLNVSGVFEDFPENSTFRANFIASMKLGEKQLPALLNAFTNNKFTYEYYQSHKWEFPFLITYLLTDSQFKQDKFESELRSLEKKYLDHPENTSYHLQKMKDIYFHSDHITVSGSTKAGDISDIYIFILVGFLILLIACINYILLSTSQALERSTEIGIRKITGATPRDLNRQVLTESFIVSVIAFGLSLIIIEQFRPFIIQIMGKDFLNYELNLKILTGFGFVLFLVTYIPGLFTVRFFSKIRPVAALNTDSTPGFKKNTFKKTLITIQFVIFLSLVSISLGIYKQIQYFKEHNLGFEPDHVLTFSIGNKPSLKNSYKALKEELLKHKDINQVSAGMWVPPTSSRMNVSLTPVDPSGNNINVEALYVDKDFLETLNISLVQGKRLCDFQNNFQRKVLINETAVKALGYDDPLGENTGMGEIVGIIQDFHYHSFREKIPPMMLVGGENMVNEVLVKTSGENIESVKNFIKNKFDRFSGSENIALSFLNEHFQTLYKKDRVMALMISFFAGIAILIALMGLVGLTIFTLKKRTKEIAIRKVNGATVSNILRLISAGYVKLIFVAFLIAVPISYSFLQNWLGDFAYKTSISWFLFAIPLALGLMITMVTVSFQSYRAASKNPVESLRYE